MVNRVDVIGLGPSANLWRPGEHYSIGVNDCWRHGKTDRLVVVNDFRKEPHREKYIITADPPDGLWSHLRLWREHPRFQFLQMRQYFRRVEPGVVYKSGFSSPFIAMSMAVAMGAQQVVLYGVDFVDHPMFNAANNNAILSREVQLYCMFSETVAQKGIKIQIASNYGALKGLIPALN